MLSCHARAAAAAAFLAAGCAAAPEPVGASRLAGDPAASDQAPWEGAAPGECADGADNDGDGAYDCDDEDCAGAPDCDDEDPAPTGDSEAGGEDTDAPAAATAAEAAAAAARWAARDAAWAAMGDTAWDWIDFGGVPGLAVGVILDGELAYASGFGVTHYGGGVPVTTDTTFRWNSVSKMHTGAAVMQAVEQGLLDLHAPITDTLPDLDLDPGYDPSSLTLHHLMTHTAGLPDIWDTACDASLEGFWAVSSPSLMAEPGALFNYSNAGWSLAGRALEVASGQPFMERLRDHLFLPMGMETATFDPVEAQEGPHTMGYYDGTFYDLDEHDCAYMRPASWMHGSVLDLARSAAFFLGDGEGVLSRASMDALSGQEPTFIGLGSEYGYGQYSWSFQGVDVLSHSGAGSAYLSYWMIAPEQGFGVVVVANTSVGAPSDIAYEAAARFLDLPGGWSPDYTTDPSTWSRYVGRYEDPLNVGTVEITLEDDQLYARCGDGTDGERRLYQYTRDQFFFEYDGLNYIRFVPGDDDEIRYFANRYYVAERDDGPGGAPAPAPADVVAERVRRGAEVTARPLGWIDLD